MARPTHFWRASHHFDFVAHRPASLQVREQLTKNNMKEALHSMFFGVQSYPNKHVKQYFYRQHAIIIALTILITLAIAISFFQILY